jgi:hypothetical protein
MNELSPELTRQALHPAMHRRSCAEAPGAAPYGVDARNRGPPSASASSPCPLHDPTPSTWTSRNERRNTTVMVPRRAKTRSRSPSQTRRGDHAEYVDLPPPLERIPFSAPWHGAPKDDFSVTAHAWPIELFERTCTGNDGREFLHELDRVEQQMSGAITSGRLELDTDAPVGAEAGAVLGQAANARVRRRRGGDRCPSAANLALDPPTG